MGLNKYLAALILLVILVVGYFFLKPGAEITSLDQVSARGKHISLYHYFSGPLGGGINDMIFEVNGQQQEHKVTAHAIDHEAFKSMILPTLSAGNPPELFTYWAGARTEKLVGQGLLKPIDDFWEKYSLNDRFSQAMVSAAVTYEGKKYLLPITQHIVVFFYNKRIFQQAAIEPPETWHDFTIALDKLKSAGFTPIALGAKERWPAQFWFDYLLLRTAGLEYRNKLMRGEAAYTDPEVKRVYKLWAELLSRGVFNEGANNQDWDEALDGLCNGNTAVTLMGTWAIQYLQGNNCKLEEEIGFDYFTFPVINEEVEIVSLGPVDGIVLSEQSANHEFAGTVLLHFAEDPAQKMMSKGSGGFSPSMNVSADFYTPFKQRIFSEITNSPLWAFNYDLATPPPVAEYGLDSFNELIAFPNQYENILENLAHGASSYFNQLNGQ